ncbi:protein CASC1-like [Centruroides sculpturatus]|uniref:protein CASC1-like n=1 Tax=Centruroides sculpturatus TaxID=218467 RepID=UPI000C6DFCD1|nr:protein CASC1-like [Centruroides sculpturatus]
MQHVQYDHLDEYPTRKIEIYLWGNLSQIPRYEGPKFAEGGHEIQIPYFLKIKKCAIIILHTAFDFYSSLHTIPEEEKLTEEQKETEVAASPDNIGGGIEVQILPAEPNKLTIAEQEQYLSPKTPSSKRESFSTASAGSEIKSRPESVQSNRSNINEEEDEPSEVIDMVGNYILGGIFQVELVEIPPQPVQKGCWIIQQVEDIPKPRCIPFYVRVVPPRPPKPNMKPTEVASFAESENKRYEEELVNTASISLTLPENTIYLDQPRPAFWYAKKSCWVADGFHEVKYREENRQLSFKATRWGIIGIVQNKYINFPYQSWQLVPQSDLDSAQLTITGSLVSLTIEINDKFCRVTRLQTLEDSVTHPNIGKEWSKPKHLLKELKEAGIFLTPEESAKSYLGNAPKDSQLEDDVYKQMALCSNVYAFGWSHWNSTNKSHRIVMKCVEMCKRESEGMNTLLMVEQERAFFLQCHEMSSSFSDEPFENTQYFATLYHLLSSHLSEEGLQRQKKCGSIYYKNIYTLLLSIKLLSY